MDSVLSFLLAVVLGLAGLRKLRSGETFEAALRELVAPSAVSALRLAVPACELALAAWLLSGWAPTAAAAAAVALLLGSSGALLRLARRGWSEGCGCFGDHATDDDPGLELARNVALLAAAVAVLVSPGTGGPGSGGAAAAAGHAAVALGLILSWYGALRIARALRREPSDAMSSESVPDSSEPDVLGWDGTTRRRFLQGASAGALALAGSRLAWPVEDARAGLRTGCWGSKDVQVCYRPWRVVAPEPGRADGIVVRKGPSFSAPVLTSSHGIEVIPVGHHFGRQSARIGNPCGTDPGPRLQANGWLWISGNSSDLGYARKSGWVPFYVGGTTYATGDNAFSGSTCGPCCDFDCRHRQAPYASPCTRYNGCNSGQAGPVTDTAAYWTIKDNGDLSNSEWYTVRYAADSVPIFWLVPGDVVYRHGYKKIYESSGPRGAGYYTWSCVGIVCAQWAPQGCGGWVRSDVLTNPRSSAGSCSSRVSIPCPG
jgi:hypothetical protein